jgi:hypothetical protein
MASPVNVRSNAVYGTATGFQVTWRYFILAAVGVFLIAPVFVDRNLNEPHMILTVILGSMMIALAASKILATVDGRALRLAFAVLGALFAVLPWLAPEQSNPLGTYHVLSHLVSGGIVLTLSLAHIGDANK